MTAAGAGAGAGVGAGPGAGAGACVVSHGSATAGEVYCLALRVAATHTTQLGSRRDVNDAVVRLVVLLAGTALRRRWRPRS